MGTQDLSWRKSSHSGGNSNCVEVAFLLDHAGIRDDKDPNAAHLTVALAHRRAFLASL